MWEDKTKVLQSSLSRFRWVRDSTLLKISDCASQRLKSQSIDMLYLCSCDSNIICDVSEIFSFIEVFASEEFTHKHLDVDDTESAWKLSKEKNKPLKGENKIHLNILPSALTCWIFASSCFGLSPSSLVAVMANWYTFPLSNSIFNSLTETSLIFLISVHCPSFPSVTTLWYTVYIVITFPLLSGSLHFKVIVSSVVSPGRSSIFTISGAPRLMSTTRSVGNF